MLGCNNYNCIGLCDPHEKQLSVEECEFSSDYRLKRGKENIWNEMSYSQTFSKWLTEKTEWEIYLELSDILLILDLLEA